MTAWEYQILQTFFFCCLCVRWNLSCLFLIISAFLLFLLPYHAQHWSHAFRRIFATITKCNPAYNRYPNTMLCGSVFIDQSRENRINDTVTVIVIVSMSSSHCFRHRHSDYTVIVSSLRFRSRLSVIVTVSSQCLPRYDVVTVSVPTVQCPCQSGVTVTMYSVVLVTVSLLHCCHRHSLSVVTVTVSS